MSNNGLLKMTLLACTVLVAACVSVDPDHQATKLDVTQLSVDEETKLNIQLDERAVQWWQKFNDPMLNRLMDLSLSYNQSLQAAQANVAAAYAVFSDVDTANWPKGGPAFDYNRQNQAVPGFNQERVDIRSYRAGAQLTWNLDLFGKLRRSAEAALADAQAQYYLWNDLQVSLTAQLAQTYGEFKGLKARINVAERNIVSLEKTRSIIDVRLEAGFASQLDLHRIDAQLYGVKATIPELKAAAERAKNTLVALIGGQQILGDIDLAELDQNLPDLSQPLAIGEPTALLRRRADLQAAERQLAAATAKIGVSKAELYPDLSVSGFLGFLSGDLSSLGESETKAWSVAPSLSWSMFNLSSIQANIDIANANEKAALANFKQQVLNVLSEAQSSLSDYAEVQQQRHLLEAQTKASRDALTIAQEQYDAGIIDLFDMLDVERSLLTAEDNFSQAKTRSFTSIIQVYQAFGGGFDLGHAAAH